MRLTQDQVADDNPQLAITPAGDFVLLWVKGSEISSAVNFALDARTVVRTAEYTTNQADFKLARGADGRLALVWVEPQEFSSDIWAVFYDSALRVWGAPRQLTFDPETEGGLTAAFSSSTLVAVYNRTQLEPVQMMRKTARNQTRTFTIPRAGLTALAMVQHTVGGDLAVRAQSLQITPTNPRSGQAVELSVTVANLGEVAAKEVPVTFYRGDPAQGGTAIGTATLSDTLAPGAEHSVTLPWVVPPTGVPLDFYAVVDPAQEFEDRNRANNVANGRFVKGDLAIQTMRWEQVGPTLLAVTVRVMNQGSVPSTETAFTVRRDGPAGPVLTIQTVPALEPDQAVDLAVTWDIQGLALPQYLLYAVVDEEGRVEDFDRTNNARAIVLQPSPTLALTKAGTGSGTVTSNPAGIACGATCAAAFEYGTSVTLTATPAAGSTFTGWSGEGCSGTGTCTVTMTQARGVTATFTLQSFTLTVTKAGTGSGTVTSNPAGIACGATCAAAFEYGTSVTLTATPAAGSTFTGWSGEGCSDTGTCTVTMTQARGVTATFDQAPALTLTIATNAATFRTGDSVSIAVGVNNPGLATTVDFYFGALLPDGDTVIFFTDFGFTSGVGSLANPGTLRPIVAGVNLTAPFVFSEAAFFTYRWDGTEPSGSYVLFLAAVRPGALVDNVINPGDIVALATAAVTFTP